MPNPRDVAIREVSTRYQQYGYRTPIKFGGRISSSMTLLDVEMRIEGRAGQPALGSGSMPLGNTWSFPSDLVGSEKTLEAMRVLAERIRKVTAGVLV